MPKYNSFPTSGYNVIFSRLAINSSPQVKGISLDVATEDRRGGCVNKFGDDLCRFHIQGNGGCSGNMKMFFWRHCRKSCHWCG